jgi:hypothetical protein
MGHRPIAPSDRLPLPERARLLALGRRLLEILPNPSTARDLALELVRELAMGSAYSAGASAG